MIIVTGANRGIGYEVGRILSEKYTVLAITRNGNELDYPCIQVRADITEDPSNLFDEIMKHGIPSALVNCAGVLSDESEMMDVNLHGAVGLTEEFVSRTDKGTVIHFSTMAKMYDETNEWYVKSKLMLEDYINNRRKECKSHRFTTLVPGYVNTDMIRGFMPRYRVLDPSDVADVVDFVLSRPEHVQIREVMISSSSQREC